MRCDRATSDGWRARRLDALGRVIAAHAAQYSKRRSAGCSQLAVLKANVAQVDSLTLSDRVPDCVDKLYTVHSARLDHGSAEKKCGEYGGVGSVRWSARARGSQLNDGVAGERASPWVAAQ